MVLLQELVWLLTTVSQSLATAWSQSAFLLEFERQRAYNQGVRVMDAKREYKATLFSKLFNDTDRLRELYNAIADTDYGEDTPIEINTLESVFFNDFRNDLSFTIGGKYVVLLEHQSTINSNMPLRCLMYIARVYEQITDNRALYHKKLLQIPTPEFIVLYNGVQDFPAEETLRLSDAYAGQDESITKFGSLELTVRIVNINPGYNEALLKKSETLKGYTAFVERIRDNQRKGANLYDVINEAINWGISNGILGAFLEKQGSEVNSMIMTEFNIDIAKEVWQEEAREDGFEEGRVEGRVEGRAVGFAEATEKYEQAIAEKDNAIADKDSVIADKDSVIADKDSVIADKDNVIADIKAENERLAALVTKLQGGQ